ncbi:MAG TPA: hypothetical protein VHB02_02085 [Acidimicrobiales bacterium]|nr:hypothetical protein [Acidimicrobiales bacterium]
MGQLERLLLVGCPDLMEPTAVLLGTGTGGARSGRGDRDPGEEGRRFRRMAAVVDALAEVCPWIDPIRPGVLALPIRGPARYFGGEDAVRERVAAVAVAALRAAGSDPAGSDRDGSDPDGSDRDSSDRDGRPGDPAVLTGVAEGVFAASLAALAGATVPAGGTPAFLAPWPVDTLAVPDLAELLVRLGLPTLGHFAAVDVREVLARFGNVGALAHRVATGSAGELPGYRTPGLDGRLAVLRRHVPLRNHQPGFWGGTGEADDRAAGSLVALQRQLGPEAVAVAVLAGGRGPADRAILVPWRPDAGPDASDTAAGTDGAAGIAGAAVRPGRGRKPALPPAPWPGRLPPPAPARVPASGPPVELQDRTGAVVGVTARGLLTAAPARLSLAGRPWSPVTGWSAPWPAEEGWWSPAGRRSVRLQVATDDGAAHLLVAEHGRWRLEATYD